MARTPTEGSGQGPDQSQATILSSVDGAPVHLPDGVDLGSLDLARDGQDLVMTAPDGQVFIIEGYFLSADAPLIISADGSLLNPALVQSFLTTAGDVQVAANGQTNDQSPVGEITEVSGKASVTHADGTKETIAVGTQIFEGDIIETDAKGAVNIHFADDSTFAVSQNARLAVDDFSFNPDDQSGSTGLSILRGVFMFTSGLVGRENPDAVHLETPVGSIGIRGTIIGGEIAPNGQSQISVIEGAIVVRNGTGEQILSDQFETVQLTGFNAPISNIGTLDAGRMSQSYGAVRSVSPTLFTSIDDTAKDNNQPQQGQPQNEQTQPQDAQPQNQTAPAVEAPLPSSMNDSPVVFQALSTGSTNIPHATAPAPQPAASQPPVMAAPAAQAPTPPAPPATPPAPVETGPADLAPQFGAVGAAIPLAESAFVYLTTAIAGAIDPEGGTASITYTVIGENKGYIVVDGNRATSFTQAQLEAGNRVKYVHGGDEPGSGPANFTLVATDAKGHTSSPLTVSFSISNVNDAPSNMELSGNHIAENSAAATLVGTVTRTDPDAGDTATYSMKDSAGGRFAIDSLTGEITVVSGTSLNRETASSHTITVEVRDAAGLTYEKNFTITVDNVNEAPTDISLSNNTVNENVAIGTVVGTASTTDVDVGDTFTYELINNTDGYFAIDSSGHVTVASALDYEAIGATHTITIRTTDHDGLYFDKNMMITLGNMNDAPTGATLSNDTIAENSSYGTVVGMVTGTDPEGDTLTYSLTGAGGAFAINATTGLITVANGSLLDYEDNDTHTITVTVSDGTGSYEKDFDIHLSNVAETATGVSIVSNAGFAERPASGAPAIFLSTVTVTDEESPANNPAYSFIVQRDLGSNNWVNDTSSQRFEVVNNNGSWELQAKAGISFDFESEADIHLRVVLTDGGQAVPVSNPIHVNFTDINEDAISFRFNNDENVSAAPLIHSILSGNVKGAVIGILETVDPDLAADKIPTAAHYKISGVSGTTLTKDDFEIKLMGEPGDQELVVKLKDNVFADFTTQQTLSVQITLDGAMNGFGVGTDIVRSFTISGRNDMMLLEAVNGNNGFMIENDSRFGARFGAALAAGDYNNDGKIDLIFGAPLAVNGEGFNEPSGGIYSLLMDVGLMNDAQNGIVRLRTITGRDDYNPTSDSTNGFFHELSTGGASNDSFSFFGSEVVTLSRFNGTAGSDIAVTNPGDGRVEIRSGITGEVTTIITNIPTDGINPANQATGVDLAKNIHIASAGDINGDGYTDLLVSSTLADTGGNNSGRVGIIFGSADHGNGGINTIDFSALQNNLTSIGVDVAEAHFGAAMAGLGDFDGDGLDDFVVSAPDLGANGEGAVFVYSGAHNALTNTITTTRLKISGTQPGEHLGSVVSNAGDFNGDGRNDLLLRSSTGPVGADGTRGAIYMIYGDEGLRGLDLNIMQLNNASVAGGNFNGVKIHWSANDSSIRVGDVISSAGDFNGDGFDDIMVDVSKVVGTEGSNTLYDHTLYVLYGTAGAGVEYNLDTVLNNASQGYKIQLFDSTSKYITAISAGDINGDGYDDLMIGTPDTLEDGQLEHDGAAYVVYGNNYDNKATDFAGTATATENGRAYVGSATGDSFYDGADIGSAKTNLSFNGGAGADFFKIHTDAAVRHYDGGAGKDTLMLFFSSAEGGNGIANTIDLRGIGERMTSVEEISFGATGGQISLKDNLILDLKDILSLMASSETHSLTISAQATAASGGENRLTIYNGTSLILDGANLNGNLTNIGFTKDVGSNGQDTASINGGTDNAYVYTHMETGFQLIVDSRIAGAQNMSAA